MALPVRMFVSASRIAAAGLLLALGGACKPSGTASPATNGAAVDRKEHAFFDGEGKPVELAGFIAGLADVDLVGFGEFHNHAVGSEVELAVLTGMAAQARPVALAMEFFEADQQAALDEYLAGASDESDFRRRTRRDAKYDDSHRPLIEFARAHGIPVIAANAPRALVTAYRKSGQPYQAWLATRSEAERAALPASSIPPDDEFKARFLATMGPERGRAFYPSMCLWNDAMAEAAAEFRATHPEHRVLLVVGGYHVARHLGVVTQYLARRPGEVVKVLLMSLAEGPMAFAAADRGEGDVILKVRG